MKKMKDEKLMEKNNEKTYDEEFKETGMICPECGSKIYKHFHKEILRGIVRWKNFICQNLCELNCSNCINTNPHGECNVNNCYAISKYKPRGK